MNSVLFVSLALGSSLLVSCIEKEDPWLTEDDDGDGISNGDEEEMGTDPAQADSDGDGYLDPWEIAEGTDPTDKRDVIYEGGWPYQPDKDQYVDENNTIDGEPTIGDVVPRMLGDDQFGDEVDLYDYAGQGKVTVLDLSAQWCPPCQSIASYMSGKSDDGWSSIIPDLPGLVEDGEIQWVTVMLQDNAGNAPTGETSEEWADDYPDDNIPVVADDGTYFAIAAWYPTFILVDEDMTILSSAEWSDSRYLEALYFVQDEYGR